MTRRGRCATIARMKNVLVLGATGLVGGAIAQAFARAGHTVLAVGRNQAALDKLAASGPSLQRLAGDVGSDEAAERTALSALATLGHIDLVVASLNPPRSTARLSELPTAEIAAHLDASVLTHLRAAKAFVPRISPGGAYVAIGGASSDFVWSDRGHISVGQAAQRMMFRVLTQEYKAKGSSVALREYIIAAMVHDGSGTQGVSAATIGEDFVRFAALPDLGGEAPTRFPPRQG